MIGDIFYFCLGLLILWLLISLIIWILKGIFSFLGAFWGGLTGANTSTNKNPSTPQSAPSAKPAFKIEKPNRDARPPDDKIVKAATNPAIFADINIENKTAVINQAISDSPGLQKHENKDKAYSELFENVSSVKITEKGELDIVAENIPKKIFYAGVPEPEDKVFHKDAISTHKINKVSFFEFISLSEDEAEYILICNNYTMDLLKGNQAYTVTSAIDVENPKSQLKNSFIIIEKGSAYRDYENDNWNITQKAKIKFE